MFGRGGEEMDFLQQQGIHVRVIPGMQQLRFIEDLDPQFLLRCWLAPPLLHV